ncbi:hypothetical protein C1646_774456 [Rhizophagus diaphanus]|nr:hypothetical protein C1646_774456 [Rhizophagus diaphanus] [Rhizophagus sp. MUCL 43196]
MINWESLKNLNDELKSEPEDVLMDRNYMYYSKDDKKYKLTKVQNVIDDGIWDERIEIEDRDGFLGGYLIVSLGGRQLTDDYHIKSHPISNKRDTEINELHTHENNVIIGVELDNENDDTENEEIIDKESFTENSRILSSKEESSEESSEESNEESDEEFSEELSGEYSSNEFYEKSDEEFSKESSGEYSNNESSDESSSALHEPARAKLHLSQLMSQLSSYRALESSDEFNEKPMENEKIVDESLKSEHMPYINKEFTPYFSNIMETLMFC